MTEQRRVITAAHQFQHLIAAGLQRHMEMRHEATRRRHPIDNLIGEQIRLYRGNAVTLYSVNLVQSLYKVKERIISPLSEITYVHSGQHDLLATFSGNLTRLCNKIIYMP